MPKYFGTDGFRGEANKDLTAEHAFAIGRFFGWYYGQEHKAKIVIGKDTRRSSYMLEYALTAGILSSGADAYLMHVTTTPSVSHITHVEDFDCGIMISASHNPYYDNGIKILNSQGEKMDDALLEQCEAFIDHEIEIPVAHKDGIGRAHDYSCGRKVYTDYILSCLNAGSAKGLKIAIDCANGASFEEAKAIFATIGAEVHFLHDAPDGYNINTDCGSTHMGKLQSYVRENGMDLGFAFDGDADRCLAVDEDGKIVDGDAIMYICGKYLMSQGKLRGNTVVTTVMSNFGLYKSLEKAGMVSEKTAVGDKYVYECMRRDGYDIGGEQSGHIIFGELANTGDGMLTAVKVLDVILSEGKSLKELASPVEVYPQLLVNIRVKSKPETLGDPDVVKAVEDAAAALGDTGRILVRQSGTEPLIRVMVEAGDDATCEKYVYSVIDVIKAKGHEA